ncbi:hypothetical protein PRUPE_5G103700 [Prunus persica]|uniref:Histone deacetylase complex subunit SAP30 Sin3 binding domain-containing protein n=4 Tax=Prunus TaxID=3754 RepID=M5W9J4_PRUPE|nr:uncharacterized protein LOC18776444 isoform X1 [Prunus persica]XP_008238930.1 PREDICTED: uncharacterized protein LOC103337546 [Prunus mume]XP_020420118.1 uncharacterized protein LOC18776444 isoform X1 [Prunus persica]XP_034216749.1 uncharacterized protein LOC117628408 isoform X1 [Prunus dulcis]XP_034216750.1 uncharacterized protein LOC117628408 isoform X1 [Prunus dulcis]KAH0974855.1 hypothetical protein GBA52_016754 [Prunus armeniaca]KAI5328972.1 hypothetical protein L3X38_028369 [Prunus d
MLEPELCSSRMLSPFREESGDEELSVLPRHTKVIVTGNNRTKSVLVGLQGVVKKAVGLGGWHWLVLKNGVEVKLQRNALSVLEHPTGNEEDSDHDYSSSSSDHGDKENDFSRCLEFHKSSKPRVRYPRPYVPSTLTKSINRGSYREVQSIHRPQPRVNLAKLGTSTLRRYCRHFNLLTSNSNPTREQLINVAQRHFISQQMPLDEVSVVTEFVDATRSRKYAEWAGKRAEREM